MITHERINYLDGLRGILAVIVFIHHFFYCFNSDFLFGGSSDTFELGKMTMSRFIAYTPLNMIANPGMAISFFFFLSGYVQSNHYLKTNDSTFLRKSFIKRYFRLAIPVLSVVILVFLFHRLHFINNTSLPFNAQANGWIKSMLPDNLNFFEAVKFALAGCFNGKPAYYQILWTMNTEIYNSFMIIILLLVTHKINNKIPLLVAWLIFQCFFLQIYYSAMFTLGLLICNLHLNSPGFNRFFSRQYIKTLCLIVGIYFASYPFTAYENGTDHSLYQLISFFDESHNLVSYLIGDALLFVFLLHSFTAKKILSKSVFLFFGEISFMFYLVHFLILFSFSGWLYQKLRPGLVNEANLWFNALASFAVITLVSYLLTICIDKPALRLGNSYIKKIFDL